MDIVILGGGVIGCTIARTFLQLGYKVTIIAKHLPGDEDIWYASNWAGAMFHGSGENERERYMQTVSYRRFMDDALKNPKSGVCIVTMREHFEKDPNKGDNNTMWFSNLVGKFKSLKKGNFNTDSNDFEYTCEYENLVIDPTIYLPFIKKEIDKLGGKFIRKEITSVEGLFSNFPTCEIFINATGLGSMFIEGIMDDKCYPDRGQTVKVRTKTDTIFYRNGKEYTYLIPRPLQGILICGGVNQPGNTSPEPDMEIVKDELKRAHKLAPHVISDNPDIAGYVVGIRPGRKDGFRLERENFGDKKMIHAYGFGGEGYIYSWGASYEVLKIVEKIEKEKVLKFATKSKF